MRIGIYTDQVYRSDGDVLSTNRAFVRFVTSLGPRVDEVVLFGRLDPAGGRDPYTLPAGVRLVPLPFYPRVTAVASLAAAARRSCAIFARELEHLDGVWIFGPHPLALAFARIARRRGVRLFLGVRQDYPAYLANRLSGTTRTLGLPTARLLDRSFRRLARTTPTVVVGDALARKYAGGPVLTTGFSLIRADEIVDAAEAHGRSWDGDELRLLTVTRLDPEKNPILLPEILERLRRRDPRWRLTVAGDGPERTAVEERARDLGVAERFEVLGEVANGPALWALYRDAHAFLHVSLTEGLPQVLFEAQAAGLPIVATDVGGVSAALGGGESGLLVRPRDADAAASAVATLADRSLRAQLIDAGLARAATETLDAQLDRIVAFFASARVAAIDAAAPASARTSQK